MSISKAVNCMKLSTEIFGSVIVIHAPEELNEDNSEQLERFLTSRERQNVIFDLDGTEAVDSAALNALLDIQDVLREMQGDLKIYTSNSVNQTILRITRLDQQLEVFESIIDAVKSFK